MTIALDSSSRFAGDPTNAQPHTFVGGSVAAPAGALVLVAASCNAASGHPTSKIDVAASGGHTPILIRRLSQADGGGSHNAPIGVWGFEANGTSFQVTQTDTSAGFAMSQAVWVFTEADVSDIAALADFVFVSSGTPTISDTAAQDGMVVVFALNDWNNGSDLPAGAAGMTTDLAIQGSGDAIPAYYGHKFVDTGAWSVGTAALSNQGGTNAIAVLVPPESATPPAEGTAATSVELDLAATGQTDHEGSAATSTTLALAVTGQADHESSVAASTTLSLAVTGETDHESVQALDITLMLSATGARPSEGSAGLTIAEQLSAIAASAVIPGHLRARSQTSGLEARHA